MVRLAVSVVEKDLPISIVCNIEMRNSRYYYRMNANKGTKLKAVRDLNYLLDAKTDLLQVGELDLAKRLFTARFPRKERELVRVPIIL